MERLEGGCLRCERHRHSQPQLRPRTLWNDDVVERNETSSAVPCGSERFDQFAVTNNAEPVHVLQPGLIEPVLGSGFIIRRPHEEW